MTNKVKVLVVDDDLSSLSRIYINLVLQDYEVEATHKATEVLARIKRFQPHIVILNYDLPDLDSHAICKASKEQLFSVIVTVKEAKATPWKIGSCTAAESLQRPVDLATLKAKIDSLLLKVYA